MCFISTRSVSIKTYPHYIQLFRERLSEEVHGTIPKGIVGGFEFTVLSKKFERMAREAMDICLRVLQESNKSRLDSYSVRNSVLLISHTTFRDCRVHIFSDNFSRNSCTQMDHQNISPFYIPGVKDPLLTGKSDATTFYSGHCIMIPIQLY